MRTPIVLASGSAARLRLLTAAGLTIEPCPVAVDEPALRAAMLAEKETPRDIVDALAEAKARRAARKAPGAIVLGCDQILDLNGHILNKPADRFAAAEQLRHLSGKIHALHTAVVAYRDGTPLWRHLESPRLSTRTLSPSFIAAYLDRNWPDVSGSVGAYHIEKEGPRLFSRIEGDLFSIQGLPLLPLLNWLTDTGVIEA